MNKIIKSLLFVAAAAVATGCIKETLPQSSVVTSGQVAESSSALEAMLKSIPSAMVATGTAGYMSKYDHHGDFGIGKGRNCTGTADVSGEGKVF